MAERKILCITDLTPASDTALHHAALVARRLDWRITHLHVLPRNERGADTRTALHAAMLEQLDRCNARDIGHPRLVEDEVIPGIQAATAQHSGLLVAGTHGPQGLRQSLFGADMIKVVRRSAMPAIVVQEGAVAAPLQRIVLPVAAHPDIDRLVDAVCLLAHAFGSEVHLYQLARPNEQPSGELLANKERVIDRLEDEGIRWIHPVEPGSVFSIGFAGPTIRYAERVQAGLIAVMADASDEYRYMADAEKERLLTNPAKIPVLYA